MKRSWLMACIVLIFVGWTTFLALIPSGGCEVKKPKVEIPQVITAKEPIYTSCPAPDTIIYPEKSPQQVSFTCPLNEQQLTVVREPTYMTYFRCSCPE